MKAPTLFLFLLISASCLAQKDRVVKYDFDTYNGEIKKGWLFDEPTYRRLYLSYNASDTIFSYYREVSIEMKKAVDGLGYIVDRYEEKSKNDDVLIIQKQQSIGGLKIAVDLSIKDNEKLLNQFWKVGSMRIHRGTAITIGVPALLLGYLVGK